MRRMLISALMASLFSTVLTLFCVSLRAQGPMDGGQTGGWGEDLLVVFWNVENLFDCEGENGGEDRL